LKYSNEEIITDNISDFEMETKAILISHLRFAVR